MSELLVAGMAYLDVFVPPVAAPAPGQEVFVDAIDLSFGGAANSASVAAALGLEVAMCVPQGDGFADAALAALAQRLGIALVPLAGAGGCAVSLVLSDQRERSFISAANFAALDQITALPHASWILVPGLEEATRLAPALAQARRRGARIAVSASWHPPALARLGQMRATPWDLLVLNEQEAAMAGAGNAAQDCAAALAGAAQSVVLTLGAAGARGVLQGIPVSAPAPAVDALDTTGAGDALCAGLLAALMRGQSPAAALAMGASCAGRIVRQRGGVLQDRGRIAALRAEAPW